MTVRLTIIAAALLLAAIASFGQGARQAQAQEQTREECEAGGGTVIELGGGEFVCLPPPEEEVIEADKPEDYAALEALYDATNGDDWNDNTNWKSNKPLGEWYGITTYPEGTAYEGRVQILSLEENNLVGTIPSELGDLSRATLIDLSRNKLTGGIPKELSKIAPLDRLQLDSNQLTGNIPPEFGNLKKIHFWYLQNNQLSGTLPAELTRIPPQSHLHLDVRNNAGICAPPDASFQAWTREIGSYDGETCARQPKWHPSYLSAVMIELHDDEHEDEHEDEMSTKTMKRMTAMKTMTKTNTKTKMTSTKD